MKAVRIPLPKGSPEKGFNCEVFFINQFERYRFEHAGIIKIDGRIIGEGERMLILSSYSKPVEGKCEAEGYIPSRGIFIYFERDRMNNYKPVPSDPLSFEKVQAYKAYLKGLTIRIPQGWNSKRKFTAFYLMLLNKNDMFKRITSLEAIKKMIEELPLPFEVSDTLALSIYKQLNERIKYNKQKYRYLDPSDLREAIKHENTRKDYESALELFQHENPGFPGLFD